MKCNEVQDYLSAWMDDEVPVGLRRGLADHLAGCPVCQAELAALTRLEAAMAELEAPAPRDLAAKVRRRLPRRAAPWRQSLALAACLVVGIFLGSSLTGTLYPAPVHVNGFTNDEVSLEILQDYPQGSVGGAFFDSGEEEGSA